MDDPDDPADQVDPAKPGDPAAKPGEKEKEVVKSKTSSA